MWVNYIQLSNGNICYVLAIVLKTMHVKSFYLREASTIIGKLVQ